MKKFTLLAFIFLLSLSGLTTHAEDNKEIQSTPTRQNIIRERIEKQKQSYVQNLQEARDVAKQYREAKTPEQREGLRREARKGFMIRLSNAAEKLSEMQKRVETRIGEAEKNNVDTTEAKQYLTESQNYLSIVLDEQEKLKTAIVDSEDDITITKEEAKDVFDVIKTNFELSRKSLIKSIQSLKGSFIETKHEDSKDHEEDEKETEVEHGEEVEVEHD